MDGEADALALDDARIEDSVHCEGCGATFDVAEIVESPYEADDGGAHLAEAMSCIRDELEEDGECGVHVRSRQMKRGDFDALPEY